VGRWHQGMGRESCSRCGLQVHCACFKARRVCLAVVGSGGLCVVQGPVADGCFWMQLEDFAAAFHVLFSVKMLDSSKGWVLERREVRV
jgi:hypothetical protein